MSTESNSVNVSKFGNRAVGSGGFIDITQPAKKVVFLATFTTGELEVEIKDGKLNIIKEGKQKKFVRQVKQITFSGQYACHNRQPVLYVTERAVFHLTEEGMELIEYAPGIDVEKDILSQMEFRPAISAQLKQMPEEIFEDTIMRFKEAFFHKNIE